MTTNLTRAIAVLAALLLPALTLSQSSDAVLVGIVQDSRERLFPLPTLPL